LVNEAEPSSVDATFHLPSANWLMKILKCVYQRSFEINRYNSSKFLRFTVHLELKSGSPEICHLKQG